MRNSRKINEKDAAASLLTRVGLAVILLVELSGSVISNVLSGFTGLLFAFGIYRLLKNYANIKLAQNRTHELAWPDIRSRGHYVTQVVGHI